MIHRHQLEMVKDLPGKKLTIKRRFDAAPEQVWQAWTQSDILDQWWAPKPWKAETKEMDFREGGHWLYAMVGPENEKHWAKLEYLKIISKKSFTAIDSFSDENGNMNTSLPKMNWKNEFNASDGGTEVVVEVNFDKEEDIQKLIEMGFEEGFAAGLNNLDEYLNENS